MTEFLRPPTERLVHDTDNHELFVGRERLTLSPYVLDILMEVVDVEDNGPPPDLPLDPKNASDKEIQDLADLLEDLTWKLRELEIPSHAD